MKISPENFYTYLSIIKNIAGSKSFRHLYAKVGGKKTDILKNGRLSCAFFVSSILKIFGQIKNLHATVAGTEKDLKSSGWHKIKILKEGSVIIWEKINNHSHIGFYLGDNKAISNDSKSRAPEIHHYAYNGKRKIISVYSKNFS